MFEAIGYGPKISRPTRVVLASLFAAGIVACDKLQPEPKATPVPTARVVEIKRATPTVVTKKGVPTPQILPHIILEFRSQTQFSACQVDEGLPDPDCSPGAIYSDATLIQICRPGYATAERNVSAADKRKVLEEYGTTSKDAVVDHLIPLRGGGANTRANYFAQPIAGPFNSRLKDLAEGFMQKEACSQKDLGAPQALVYLRQLQQQMAADWKTIYNRIPNKEDLPDEESDDD